MTRAASLLLVLCAFTLVRADVGPHAGKKFVSVTTVVDALEDFPDYAFFEVVYEIAPGAPPQSGKPSGCSLHFFVPGSVAEGSGGPRGGRVLYAVPRAVAERIPGWNEFAADAAKHRPPKHSTVATTNTEWFALAKSVNRGEVPGATKVTFGAIEEFPATDARAHTSVHYRITRTPAGVEFVKPYVPPPSGDVGKCGNDGSESVLGEMIAGRDRMVPWRWVAAGAAIGLIFVAAGAGLVWYVLRRV